MSAIVLIICAAAGVAIYRAAVRPILRALGAI